MVFGETRDAMSVTSECWGGFFDLEHYPFEVLCGFFNSELYLVCVLGGFFILGLLPLLNAVEQVKSARPGLVLESVFDF